MGNKEEYAKKIDWKPLWDRNATSPKLLLGQFSTFLIYDLEEDEYSAIRVEPYKKVRTYPIALVEFFGSDFKFGIANDEVHSGLPLYDKGIQDGDAFIIENSTWIEELKTIHKVHPYYDENRWKDKKHYLFLFKDELFEIVATGYKIQVFDSNYEELLIDTIRKIHKT